MKHCEVRYAGDGENSASHDKRPGRDTLHNGCNSLHEIFSLIMEFELNLLEKGDDLYNEFIIEVPWARPRNSSAFLWIILKDNVCFSCGDGRKAWKPCNFKISIKVVLKIIYSYTHYHFWCQNHHGGIKFSSLE